MITIALRALLPALMSVPTWAAQGELALEAVLEEAERRNPAVLASRQRWEGALGTVKTEGALPNPDLGIGFMPESLETRAGPVKGKASLRQRLPFWGKRGLKADAASGRAAAAEAAYRAKVLEVRAEAAAAFYHLAYLGEAKGILQEQVELLRHFSRIAEKKYSVGRGAQAMVFRAQAELSRMKNEVFTVEQDAKSARARLAATLGRTSAEGIVPPAKLPMPSTGWERAEVFERALRDRPEIRALRGLERASEAERRLALKRWFPDFTVGYEVTAIGSGSTNASFDGKDAHGVSVGMSLPLWFGANRAAGKSGEHRRRAAAYDLESLELHTRADLESMLVETETSLRLTKLDEDTVLPQVRAASKATLSSYEAETASFVELLDAERSLLKSELGHARHKMMFWKTAARLERLVGGPL
jgi:outer membrane protein TolC